MKLILPDSFHTIRFKLLAALLSVLVLSIGTSMFGIWTYERDQFIDITHREARRAGRTIEKALRDAMLRNDRRAIQATIDEIAEIGEPSSRLSIVGQDGKVAFSNDKSLIGTSIDRARDPSCTICHQSRGLVPGQSAIMLSSPAGPLLRNVIKIDNQPVCYRCHPSNRKTLGVLLYDAYFENTMDMLATVAFRTLLTWIFTFLVVIVVLSFLVTRLIHRPIQALMTGFHHAGSGDFSFWVDAEGSDEFTEMADSFNVMSQAIGRYLAEIKLKNRETATLYAVVQRMSKTIEMKKLTEIVFALFFEFFEFKEIVLVQEEEKPAAGYRVTWQKKESRRPGHARLRLEMADFPHPELDRQELTHWTAGELNQPTYANSDLRVLIPLIYNNAPVGLILGRVEPERRFSGQQKKLIVALASHVAISLANARLYHLATTDGLTRLYTKRYFEDAIARLAAPTVAGSGSFQVIMMDLDHFKEVNDTYGHPVGDQVLSQLADLIRDHIRYNDIPCRFGGEEFIILLPDSKEGLGAARATAARLLKSIADYTFTCTGCPPIHRTISIGIASFPEHATTAEGVISAVDEALYTAKRDGRNRIVVAGDPAS